MNGFSSLLKRRPYLMGTVAAAVLLVGGMSTSALSAAQAPQTTEPKTSTVNTAATPAPAKPTKPAVDPYSFYRGPVTYTQSPTPLPKYISGGQSAFVENCLARVPGRVPKEIAAINTIVHEDGTAELYDADYNLIENPGLMDERIVLASMSKLPFYIALLDADSDEVFDIDAPFDMRYALPEGRRYAQEDGTPFKDKDSALSRYLVQSDNEAGRQLGIKLGKAVAGNISVLPERTVPEDSARDPLYLSYHLYKTAGQKLNKLPAGTDDYMRRMVEAEYYLAAAVYYANIRLDAHDIDIELMNVSGLPPTDIGPGGIETIPEYAPDPDAKPGEEEEATRRGFIYDEAGVAWFAEHMPSTDKNLSHWGDKPVYVNNGSLRALDKAIRVASGLEKKPEYDEVIKEMDLGIKRQTLHVDAKTGTDCGGLNMQVALAENGDVLITQYNATKRQRNANMDKLAVRSLEVTPIRATKPSPARSNLPHPASL